MILRTLVLILGLVPTIHAIEPPRIHRVELVDGQVLHGDLIGTDDQTVRLRTAWADAVAVPREMIRVIRPAGRFRVIAFVERPGAMIELPRPLDAGRVAFTIKAGKWSIETAGVRVVCDGTTVRVTGPTEPDVNVELPIGTEERRVSIEWGSKNRDVFLDERVLWAESIGPAAPVRSGATTVDGIHDLNIGERPNRIDPIDGFNTTDLVRTRAGDDWFGTLRRFDRNGVTLEGKAGRREWAWTELEGIAFRRPPAMPVPDGTRITLRGFDGTRDILVGTVISRDDAIEFQHPVLGEWKIPRDRVVKP